jgi:hypothetical protein
VSVQTLRAKGGDSYHDTIAEVIYRADGQLKIMVRTTNSYWKVTFRYRDLVPQAINRVIHSSHIHLTSLAFSPPYRHTELQHISHHHQGFAHENHASTNTEQK